MKTRTLLYTLSASVLMTLTSCNNWLDTGSSTQIRGDELLKTEAGFLDALTGIYINMSSSSMYGKNMTSYVVDMLVQPYTDFRSASNERSALMSGQYNDAQAVPFIESMWNNTYKTIASINNELKYVEANEERGAQPVRPEHDQRRAAGPAGFSPPGPDASVRIRRSSEYGRSGDASRPFPMSPYTPRRRLRS